jgi:tetratricopeptide (TPR) repeat protein
MGRKALAYHHAKCGQWAEAAALYDQCVALFGPTDNRLVPLELGPYPALALLGLGRAGEAAVRITDFLALAREVAAPHAVGCALRAQGQILAAQGQTAQAEAAFDEAVTTLDKLGSRLELGRAYYHRGLLRRSLGKTEAARDDLKRALALSEACGAAVDREQVARSLA